MKQHIGVGALALAPQTASDLASTGTNGDLVVLGACVAIGVLIVGAFLWVIHRQRTHPKG